MSRPSTKRLQLKRAVAGLSDAECREVSDYIEIMRSLRREAAAGNLFGDGFVLRSLTRAETDGRLGVSPTPGASNVEV